MSAKRPHYGVTFAGLALGGLVFALLQSLVAPALPEIQADLNTTTTAVAWVLTGYLLSASVATPILGRLGDMFGKERMLVVVLLGMGVGTLVSALAGSIELLVVGRVIQGFGGAVFPLAFGIIRDEFPRERIPTGIALISAILGFGEIYLATAVLGAGIGFAFAAMANLIVEAVPAQQTGVATGMNTIARTVGGAVGSEISASVIAGTVLATGFPTQRGFTIAFILAAAAIFVGLLTALKVPTGTLPARTPLDQPASST